MIIGPPTRELGPLHRLELATRELQGPFRRGAAGGKTHDRAEEARDQSTPRRLRTRPTVPHANKCIADGNGSAARPSIPSGTVKRLPRWRAGIEMLPGPHAAGAERSWRRRFECLSSALQLLIALAVIAATLLDPSQTAVRVG